jgi:hypothetical protein
MLAAVSEEPSEQWLARLYELNSVIAATGERLAGNLFYDHHQEDFADSPPVSFNSEKRARFRRACEGRTRMLEVGVNGGHSAYLALTANPSLELHGVDIADHAYVRPVAAWLGREFPGRFFFYEGDCLAVLPQLARRGLRFDLFHIDGGKHTYYRDILNSHRMLDGRDALVIMDDVNMGAVQRVWERCVDQGLIGPAAEFPPMPAQSSHRNAVGVLTPVARARWATYWTAAIVRGTRRRLRARLEAKLSR